MSLRAQPDACLDQPEAHTASVDCWTQWLHGLSGISPGELLAPLRAVAPRFDHLADYHYWVGVAMQAQNAEPEDIAAEYELALLIDPNHAGAWYDYGLTQCRMGRESNCQRILDEARRRFGQPPGRTAEWVPPAAWRGDIRLGLGHSSNYNQGSSSPYIPLTIDGITAEYELAPAYRAAPASYRRLELNLAYRGLLIPEFEVRGNFVHRTPFAADERAGTLNDYAVDVFWHLNAAHHLWLNLSNMRESVLGSIRVEGLRWSYTTDDSRLDATGAWAFTAGIDRRQPTAPQVAYRTVLVQLRRVQRAFAWGSAYASLGAERDLPQSQRIGQGQNRFIASAGWLLPDLLPARGAARIALGYTDSRDTQAYSPLFGDARRRTQQSDASLLMSWPIAENTQLQLDIVRVDQRSNIALFAQRESQFNLSVACSF